MDSQELILINTIKNTLPHGLETQRVQKKIKKQNRIQWFDLIPKNSINAGKRLFLNSKISNSLKKNSSAPSIVAVSSTMPQKPVLRNDSADHLPLYLELKQQYGQFNSTQPISLKQNKRAPSAKKTSLIPRMSSSNKDKQYEDFDYLSL